MSKIDPSVISSSPPVNRPILSRPTTASVMKMIHKLVPSYSSKSPKKTQAKDIQKLIDKVNRSQRKTVDIQKAFVKSLSEWGSDLPTHELRHTMGMFATLLDTMSVSILEQCEHLSSLKVNLGAISQREERQQILVTKHDLLQTKLENTALINGPQACQTMLCVDEIEENEYNLKLIEQQLARTATQNLRSTFSVFLKWVKNTNGDLMRISDDLATSIEEFSNGSAYERKSGDFELSPYKLSTDSTKVPESEKCDYISGQSYKGESYKGELYKGESYKGESYKGELYKGESYKGESYKGGSYKGGSYKGESYKGELYKGESYKGESYKGESYKDLGDSQYKIIDSPFGNEKKETSFENENFSSKDLCTKQLEIKDSPFKDPEKESQFKNWEPQLKELQSNGELLSKESQFNAEPHLKEPHSKESQFINVEIHPKESQFSNVEIHPKESQFSNVEIHPKESQFINVEIHPKESHFINVEPLSKESQLKNWESQFIHDGYHDSHLRLSEPHTFDTHLIDAHRIKAHMALEPQFKFNYDKITSGHKHPRDKVSPKEDAATLVAQQVQPVQLTREDTLESPIAGHVAILGISKEKMAAYDIRNFEQNVEGWGNPKF